MPVEIQLQHEATALNPSASIRPLRHAVPAVEAMSTERKCRSRTSALLQGDPCGFRICRNRQIIGIEIHGDCRAGTVYTNSLRHKNVFPVKFLKIYGADSQSPQNDRMTLNSAIPQKSVLPKVKFVCFKNSPRTDCLSIILSRGEREGHRTQSPFLQELPLHRQ
jgi:hypothetical protein